MNPNDRQEWSDLYKILSTHGIFEAIISDAVDGDEIEFWTKDGTLATIKRSDEMVWMRAKVKELNGSKHK